MTLPLPPAVSDPRRLAALEGYAVLDTPAEPGFDDIVQLACQLCAVPVALVSLVAGDRQWFKARAGFPLCETDLNSSVCAHALATPDRVLVIPDLAGDPRTCDNPLVTADPFIRFYAGAPLVAPDGEVLGTLCAIDHAPRPAGLTAAQLAGMRALARQVMSQLELRRALDARDAARAEESRIYRVRLALRDMQVALATTADDLDAVLRVVVEGAMRAVPAAEGGTVELVRGDALEYRAVLGTLAGEGGRRVPMDASLAGFCARSRSPVRMDDALTDPHVRREHLNRLGLRSAILMPLLHGNDVLGVIMLLSGRPGAFTERDVEVIGQFSGAASVGIAEAEARSALKANNSYWRGLFDRLSEGFLVGEVVRGGAGVPSDWRYLEVNPAWSALTGLEADAVIGRTIREVLPGVEEAWVDDFVRVVETGEAASFTRRVGSLRRWYEGRAFRIDAARFGVIFLEVTARVEAEARRAALLLLGDRLRDLHAIPAMTRAAAEIVGRTFDATRAGFGHIVGDVEYIDIDPGWLAPGQRSIAGRHRFDDYGDLREPLRQGEPLVIDDVTTDPRTRDDPARMLGIGIRALLNMPVRERGRTVAVFIVHDTRPRQWSAEELAFLRNVSDRVEVGVARVRAEELQAVLNNELAHRLKNTLAIVQSMALQTLRDVTERDLVEAFDRRVVALSRAHDVLLQKSWAAARMRAVMESVLTVQADLGRFRFDGPDMDVSPQAALSLSMLLHELATNAIKYGALSAEGGRVRIGWRTEGARGGEGVDGAEGPRGGGDDAALVLEWQESGGPAVAAPGGRGGFGSKLIRMGLMGSRKSELRYDPAGVRAAFRAPLAEIEAR